MLRIFLILGILCSLFFILTLDSRAGTPVVACCFADGSCQELDFDSCIAGSGSPDISTFCADAKCPQPSPSPGPVTIVPTMGQWGMIIATIILGFFAIVALRRRTES